MASTAEYVSPAVAAVISPGDDMSVISAGNSVAISPTAVVPVSATVAVRAGKAVPVVAMSVVTTPIVAVSIEAMSVVSVIPRASANEDSAYEEARTVISIGRARVRIIRIVAIWTNGRRTVIRIGVLVIIGVALIGITVVVVPIVRIAVVIVCIVIVVPVVITVVITVVRIIVIAIVRVAVVGVSVIVIPCAHADPDRNLGRSSRCQKQQDPRNRRISQIGHRFSFFSPIKLYERRLKSSPDAKP